MNGTPVSTVRLHPANRGIGGPALPCRGQVTVETYRFFVLDMLP